MKIKISVALEEDSVARLDELAKIIGVNRSAIIQKFIDHSLTHAEVLAQTYDRDKLQWLFRNSEFRLLTEAEIEAEEEE